MIYIMISRESASTTIASIISLATRRHQVLLFLSGGSNVIVDTMALNSLSTADRAKITIVLTDERFVPLDDQNSNWHHYYESGFVVAPSQTITILGSKNETAHEAAESYEAALIAKLSESPYIIALLGIGSNHHTAGILPNSPVLQLKNKLVGSYTASDFERITISPALFPLVDEAILYAEGDDKAEAIQSLELDLPINNNPSQLIKRCKHYRILYNKEAV
jgi:6-phosphogluconolactonase/glucosamine-6-phosphate isomerase/deaminase